VETLRWQVGEITVFGIGELSDDPAQARASTLELVEQYADSDTLIIGSHFADPVVGPIRRQGATFRLVPADG